MKFNYLQRPLAILTLAALAACGGGGSTPPRALAPTPIVTPSGGVQLVGIGDSLTFGEQADGLLGQAVPSVTSSLSSYPGNLVPAGQESGFWALLYMQLTGTTAAQMATGTTSPLPLIAGPGLGSQLVINATSLFASVQSGCDTFNQAAYGSSSWSSTRISAGTQNYDLGVPGITMHEAVAMTGPLTGPPNAPNCGYKVLANDPTSGGLQSLVSGESGAFYPVMGSYVGAVTSPTELNVAVALKPKLATVWLGANDVLKFAFSGGNPVASDTTTQMQADLTQIIKSLTATGTKVLVADLPTILTAPQFFPQGNRLIADLATLLTPGFGGNVSEATAAATAISSYVSTQYGVTTGGYLTESGFLDIVSNCSASPTTCLTPELDPSGTGSGLGAYYITPALATQINQLNAAYNEVIDAVASGSGSSVALVPINQIFSALAPSTTVPNSATNLNTIISGAPSATFQFGGNLVSWDGLHPSNLGYAVIANEFISTADTAFGMTIAPLTNTQLATIAAEDPYNGTNIDTALGEAVFPLP
ncbi:MAG TPA: hypothetical protein VMA98_04980 [Candidatus Acidoferrales bacterium]|nr:hypothetical protein [Candidatus Acidoferrales bacterium]